MSKQFDHSQIEEIIHARIRLAIMAALATVDVMDFITLLNEVNTTKGNLSIHLSKLEESKYVKIEKRFIDRKPVTLCRITSKGLNALHEYLDMVTEFAKMAKTK